LKILVIGDIVGKPGRRAVRNILPGLREDYILDFVIANGENASGGRGLNRDGMQELFACGIDVLTMGNHVWDNKEIFEFIDEQPGIIRPCNYPVSNPGQGYHIYTLNNGYRIAVINASGRVFMDNLDCPFEKTENVLREIDNKADFIIADFHAEATSEKLAFAYYFDGRVNAVLGTHTHIQTADERILTKGTAYITDLGMTGPVNSILGVEINAVIKKFLTAQPVRFEVAKGPVQLQGVILTLADSTRKIENISRISIEMPN
jgi:metallophosphoesterase (TIGR00282 family)